MTKKRQRTRPLKKIGKLSRSLVLVIFAALIPIFSVAQVNVTATPDRNVMNLGESILLTVSVSTADSSSIGEPQMTSIDGFQIEGQSSQSQSSSVFTNGSFQFQRTQRYIYQLRPEKVGKLTIDKINVKVGDKDYSTNPVAIEVKQSGAPSAQQRVAPPMPRRAPPQAPSQMGEPEDDMADAFDQADEIFNQLLQRRGFTPPSQGAAHPINPNEAFFIQAEVDKDKVYEGEQVTASWYIYTRNTIRDIDTLQYPTLKGFWKEDIQVATNLNFQNETINGVPYRKALLASYALFPIKAGTATIDPYKAKCTVLIQQGYSLFPQPYSFTKASLPIKIEVMPLPVERPKSFSGAVGQFSTSMSVERTVVPVNEPFSLKIHFEGRGNAKLIELPSLNLPDKFEQFDTKKESKFSPDGTSSKDFEVLLVPRVKGEAVIPPFEFSYFDTKKKQFVTNSSPPIQIQVVDGKGKESISEQRLKSDEYTGDNKTSELPGFVYREDYFKVLNKNKLLIWSCIFVFALIFIVIKTTKELRLGEKQKTLLAVLDRKFEEIQILATKKDWRKTGAQTVNLVYQLLGEMGGTGGGNDSLAPLVAKLPPSVNREVEGKIEEPLKYFETLAFAPEAALESLKNIKTLNLKIMEIKKLLQRAISVFEEKRE